MKVFRDTTRLDTCELYSSALYNENALPLPFVNLGLEFELTKDIFIEFLEQHKVIIHIYFWTYTIAKSDYYHLISVDDEGDQIVQTFPLDQSDAFFKAMERLISF